MQKSSSERAQTEITYWKMTTSSGGVTESAPLSIALVADQPQRSRVDSKRLGPSRLRGCSFRRGLQETAHRDPSLINAFSASAGPSQKPHVGVQLPAPPIHISLFLYLQQITHSGGKAAGIDWLCGYTILSDISQMEARLVKK